MTHKLIKTENYLLVVDESEIKEGDYVYVDKYSAYPFIFMNPPCPTPFWGNKEEAKKIIAHLPLNGSPILEGVPLLPPIKDDGLDELAEHYWKMQYIMALDESTKPYIIEDFKAGYNKAKEKYKYTDEDVRKAISVGLSIGYSPSFNIDDKQLNINNIIQSLHQYPTEFECETEPYTVGEMSEMPLGTVNQKPKTITTDQGIQWVGKYKQYDY